MYKNKGKEIIRSKSQKVFLIKVSFIFGIIFLIFSIVTWITASLYPEVILFCFLLGIFLIFFGVRPFLTYITIYENGVRIRVSASIKFFKRLYIPFNEIMNVKVDLPLDSIGALYINVKDDISYKINLMWIKNYDSIKNTILNKISNQEDKISEN